MKLRLLIVFALFANIVYSQKQDSIANPILQKIKAATNDSVKIDLELQLADRTGLFDIDTSRIIVNNVLKTINNKR